MKFNRLYYSGEFMSALQHFDTSAFNFSLLYTIHAIYSLEEINYHLCVLAIHISLF